MDLTRGNDLADQINSVSKRASCGLRFLTGLERAAYLAGRAERWCELLIAIAVGFAIGIMLCLSGCGGGEDDAETPNVSTQPVSCATQPRPVGCL